MHTNVLKLTGSNRWRGDNRKVLFHCCNPVKNGETRVLCAFSSRNLKSIRQKCYFVERSRTLKEEGNALQKTKRILIAEILIILGVSAEAHSSKKWRLCSQKTTTSALKKFAIIQKNARLPQSLNWFPLLLVPLILLNIPSFHAR